MRYVRFSLLRIKKAPLVAMERFYVYQLKIYIKANQLFRQLALHIS